jgi:hypothetical protein
MKGVFITKGMTVGVPAGGLKIEFDQKGELNASLTVHVRFDVCPSWIRIALQDLESAKESCAKRKLAWAGADNDEKAATLEQEFETSMQAITAAAISIDAFYAAIQPHVDIPPHLFQQWRTKWTSRYAQIAEVVRRAYSLKEKEVTILRQNLKEIFRLRDLAVHPSGKIQTPILHRELNVHA